MNFKKNWKRFWTLSQAREGFTLVELIVVIAIMAILAGVAVPAYTGYIKKAEKASDLQLLGAVNTAFAAAVMENGEVVTKLSAVPTLTLEADGTVGSVSMFPESFFKYYAGNEDSAFKVITELYFNSAEGVFAEDVGVTITYAGATFTFSMADVEALKTSTFLTAEGLGGSAGLLDKVNSVTNIAAGMASDSLSAVFGSKEFKDSAMAALKVSTEEEYLAKQREMVAAIMEKNPGMTPEQATNKLAANSAVLYAANSAINFSETQINDLFTTTGIDTIKSNLKGANTTDGMAQAALVYGMYTAYANSEKYGNATLQGNTENPLAVLNALETDDNFKNYVSSPEGQQDMNAYLGALGMINDAAASDPSAVEDLMVNGFNNSEIKGQIAGVTGK